MGRERQVERRGMMRPLLLDRRFWLLPLLAWTLLVTASAWWNGADLNDHAREMALSRGRFVFQMAEAMRHWNSRHGGVYGLATPEFPPNPYLEVPERDIETPSGRPLTLLNPAYMTRQLAAVVAEETGTRIRLTSLKPTNPGNGADPWEAEALRAFESEVGERTSLLGSGGEAVFRYIAPLVTKPSCLKCHQKEGYEVGDIRGGISVTFPAAPLLNQVAEQQRTLWAIHGAVWLLVAGLGVAALGGLRRQLLALTAAKEGQDRLVAERTAQLAAEAEERRDAEARLRLFIEASGEGIYVVDRAGRCTLINPTALRLLGYDDSAALLGRNMHDLLHPLTEEGEPCLERDCRLAAPYREGAAVHAEDALFRRADGAAFAVEYRANPVHSGGERIGAVVTFADISDRKANEEELSKLYQAVEYSPASVVITDADGNIEYVNRRFQEVTGYRLGEVLGQNPRLLKSGLTPPETYDELWATVREGRAWHGIFRNKKHDGTLYWEEAQIAPVRDRHGAIAYLVAVKEEITARKEMEERLHEAKEAAEAANRAKSEFLANLSHEIRTPMNAIIGMAELLAESRLDPEQRHYVEIFENAGNTLLGLLNDVLDLSKIEAGQLELDDHPYNPRELAEEVTAMMSFRARQRGLHLAASLQPELPRRLQGDAKRLRQVLTNLMGNAVKFTHRGEVVLRLELDPADPGRMRITVRDTGIGIPAERQAAIFDAFVQQDGAVTRQYGGTGLGLAISRRLVASMGGELWLESRVGEGSTFGFSLPLRPAAVEAPAEPPALEGLRLLVVDDYAVNRFILQELLGALGARLTLCAGWEEGQAALHAAQEAGDPFHLALLDCVMPGVDGGGAAKAIRRVAGPAELPIVILSSDVRRCHKESNRALCIEMVQKPFRRAELLEAIQRALGARGGSREIAGVAAPPAAAAARPAVRPLHILLAEDNADNVVLLQRYLKGSGHTLEVVSDGAAALTRFRGGSYDVVLMDMQMPVLDGYAATRALRAWEAEAGRRPTPVVALTAYALAEDRRRCLEAGCDEHLAKPIKKQALLAALAALAAVG